MFNRRFTVSYCRVYGSKTKNFKITSKKCTLPCYDVTGLDEVWLFKDWKVIWKAQHYWQIHVIETWYGLWWLQLKNDGNSFNEVSHSFLWYLFFINHVLFAITKIKQCQFHNYNQYYLQFWHFTAVKIKDKKP